MRAHVLPRRKARQVLDPGVPYPDVRSEIVPSPPPAAEVLHRHRPTAALVSIRINTFMGVSDDVIVREAVRLLLHGRVR